MNQSKKASVIWLLAMFVAVSALTACAPEYTRRQGEELAGQARLLDSISVDRQNQRVLSHQARVCLLSANAGDTAGADLLRTMQAGFNGYFLSVAVVGESVDYLRAVSSGVCPEASYLFYVQPVQKTDCSSDRVCTDASQFIITVISAADQSLVDRIRFSIKKSYVPATVSEHDRKQTAFEQLAVVLTGGE